MAARNGGGAVCTFAIASCLKSYHLLRSMSVGLNNVRLSGKPVSRLFIWLAGLLLVHAKINV